MRNLLKFAVAIMIAAFLIYLLRTGKLNFKKTEEDPDGKLLGLIDDKPGFGAYEVGMAAVVAGGLFVGAMALKAMKLGKYAPNAQGPTAAAA